ncbi:MAG: HEAT repeat domain-containing protein [Nitrospirota bacterium]|nr:HEAT repeat domain-containing protein [Nitrospirota bacterium]
MGKSRPVSVAAMTLCLILGGETARAGEAPLQAGDNRFLAEAKTVSIDAKTTTWRARGQVSFPLAAEIRMKLQAAGLTVVEDEPGDLVLAVDYREERRGQYRVDLHGTEIIADIDLAHPRQGSLLHLTIRASSRPDAGSRPYLDAVEQFEANPYFYFLGEIVKDRIASQTDLSGTLIAALERMPEQGRTADDSSLMLPSETLHVTWARYDIIQELGRLKDPRAIPVLTRLLGHEDWRVRRVSAEALGAIGSRSARTAIEQASRLDRHREVREAATASLARMP